MSYATLRTKIDGNDPFMTGGHGAISTAGATTHAARMKRVPVWALDDSKIKEYIKTRFPTAEQDPEQMKLAKRMALIIYLYYRVGETAAAIADRLGMTRMAVRHVVHRADKAMKSPLKKRGRPRKPGTIQATNGIAGDDSHTTL